MLSNGNDGSRLTVEAPVAPTTSTFNLDPGDRIAILAARCLPVLFKVGAALFRGEQPILDGAELDRAVESLKLLGRSK